MVKYDPTHLDSDQAIKRSFDEENRALRIIGAPVVPTSTEVVIDYTDDSVLCIDGLVNAKYDAIYASYTTTEDIYEYKLATVLQATVTVTYTDTTKLVIDSVVRT